MWSRLTTGFKFFLILLVVGGVFGAWKVFGPKASTGSSTASTPAKSGVLSKVANVFSGGPDITLGVNTWTGFAPVAWLNNGSLEPSKESILYKKYGITLRIVILDAFTNSREAFKSNNINVVYCTTDALPVEMGAGSGMSEIKAEQWLQVDWSRGGDLIVVRKGINTVADLKGKTIAVAQGTASHTFLIKTLESNGLTINDVVIKLVNDGIEASSLFQNKVVDAGVVWTPDDGNCLSAVPGSKVLVSTKSAAFVIADGLLSRNEFISKENDLLVKFGTAWLEANGQLNSNSALREEAAVAFAKCFKGVDLAFAQNGLRNVRLTTLGDNKNFFGLNSTYQGVTGEQMYSKMSITYSDLRLTKSPLPWRQVSNTSVVEKINLTGSENSAEIAPTFSPVTKALETKEAISNKKVTINFETGLYNLTDENKAIIDREFVQIAKSFGGARVRIEGNTDAVGNPSSNQELSLKRARSVANYLVTEYGFDRNKFIVVGNGSRNAINDGVTGASEAYRKTDFQLVTE